MKDKKYFTAGQDMKPRPGSPQITIPVASVME